MINQWLLIYDNNLQDDQEYIDAFIDANKTQAERFLSTGEVVIAIDIEGEIVFSTLSEDKSINENERQKLLAIITEENLPEGWIKSNFDVNKQNHVGYYFRFPELDYSVIVAANRRVFYSPIRDIIFSTIILLVIFLSIAIFLMLVFTRTLTRPIKQLSDSMEKITDNQDFSSSVPVLHDDEVGKLSMTFNIMIGKLNKAYEQIRQFAFSAVVARKGEQKVRNIFQKYVPNSVINALFSNPSQMLVGEKREVALMFTDIRNFTSISEGSDPEKLVGILNSYFEILVDIIVENGGVVDKYIGDAVMALFGAPVQLDNSAYVSVQSANLIQDALLKFNADAEKKGHPPFATGIGINYGEVTVGNIGSEKKMDYTAIGDNVNFGSRLEGLTKLYRCNLVFSHSIFTRVKGKCHVRVLDKVQVKGKSEGDFVYTSTLKLSQKEKELWQSHNEAFGQYAKGNFEKALTHFKKNQKMEKSDYLTSFYIDRCEQLVTNPPASWNGTYIMTTK